MERTHTGQHGADCFGCKVQTIAWQYPYGRDHFHGPTIKERQAKIIQGAKAEGLEPRLKSSVYTGR